MTVTAPPALPQTKSVQTQTQGLFYPSNKSISNQSNGQNNRDDSGLKERKSILTAASPGKGKNLTCS